MKTSNSKAINQVYNTAVGDQITIKQMAELIREELSSFNKSILKIPIVFGPNRDGDIPHSMASIEKAKALLNYSPSHSFKQGIEDSLEWFYNNLKQK